jgi:hypothetical protein
MLRRGPAVVVLSLIALLALIPLAGASAKTRKAPRTCVVQRYTSSGKKVVFRVSVYQYRTVHRHGHAVRTIVKRMVPLRTSCSPSKACVQVKTTADGRLAVVYSKKRARVIVKRGGRLVSRVVRTKVPQLGRCVKPGRPETAAPAPLGVPVRVTILPESKATLDFGTFQREVPIGGTMTGYSPQAQIDLTHDIPIVFSKGAMALGSAPVYVDQACGGRSTASIRTGKGATVEMDDSQSSTSVLSLKGQVSATVNLKVRMPLELRDGENGCDKPYITTQYSEFPLRIALTGKLDPKTGLSRLHISSPPTRAMDLKVCLNPGPENEPCGGYEIPMPVTIATDVYAKVEIG